MHDGDRLAPDEFRAERQHIAEPDSVIDPIRDLSPPASEIHYRQAKGTRVAGGQITVGRRRNIQDDRCFLQMPPGTVAEIRRSPERMYHPREALHCSA